MGSVFIDAPISDEERRTRLYAGDIFILSATAGTRALIGLALVYSSNALAQEQTWLKDRRYGEGVGIRTGDLELHPGIADPLRDLLTHRGHARVLVAMIEVGGQSPDEHGGPDPRSIKPRAAEMEKPDRRQVPVEDRLCKRAAASLVDGEPGKRVELSIAPDLAVVDPIVAEGAEVSNIDITVGRTIDAYSVTGTVLDSSTNAPVPDIGFSLSILAGGGNRQNMMGLMALPIVSDSNGQFRIDNVPAGKYQIAVLPQSGGGMFGQSAAFDVINEDVSGVQVSATKGANLSGVVTLDTNQQQDPSITQQLFQCQVQVFVQLAGGRQFGVTPMMTASAPR